MTALDLLETLGLVAVCASLWILVFWCVDRVLRLFH